MPNWVEVGVINVPAVEEVSVTGTVTVFAPLVNVTEVVPAK